MIHRQTAQRSADGRVIGDHFSDDVTSPGKRAIGIAHPFSALMKGPPAHPCSAALPLLKDLLGQRLQAFSRAIVALVRRLGLNGRYSLRALSSTASRSAVALAQAQLALLMDLPRMTILRATSSDRYTPRSCTAAICTSSSPLSLPLR